MYIYNIHRTLLYFSTVIYIPESFNTNISDIQMKIMLRLGMTKSINTILMLKFYLEISNI